MPDLDKVVAQAFQLDTLDKVRLIERVTPKIEEEIRQAQADSARPFPSLARQETWVRFPRKVIE